MPDPLREIFAGRILKSREIIQVVMIKTFKKWLEYAFYFAEIAYPAGVWINLPFDVKRYSE